MDRCVGAAALLAESDRRDLAIEALARSATILDLSVRHGVSCKFIYQQTGKARTALDEAFLSAALDDEVLFEVAVTKTCNCSTHPLGEKHFCFNDLPAYPFSSASFLAFKRQPRQA